MSDNLKERQTAGEKVEARMIFFLLQLKAASALTIGDAKLIAETARSIAFDEFSSINL